MGSRALEETPPALTTSCDTSGSEFPRQTILIQSLNGVQVEVIAHSITPSTVRSQTSIRHHMLFEYDEHQHVQYCTLMSMIRFTKVAKVRAPLQAVLMESIRPDVVMFVQVSGDGSYTSSSSPSIHQ